MRKKGGGEFIHLSNGINGTVPAMTVTGVQTYLTVLLLVLSIIYTIIKLIKMYRD